MSSINDNSRVTLHFTLKLVSGEVIDSTRDKQAATFTMKDGSLLPGFEQVLIGMKAGDKQEFLIKPEQGFGQPNPQNVQVIPRAHFKEMDLEVGLMFMFKDAAGSDLPGMVSRFDDKEVVIDFNHPLAGKDILFDVEIIAVE
ncbi:FKBP-type peptidyl-prolyl cis-trans isomerase [Entomomonas sp. E2T0]|uniref:FKBP-type peptidyl-prolyl cis-trans isomerase n=1 Tax=Entomomonas sp. E2T0 TaxID=2930213 RepID=UPI0022281F07|nr:FKBP-type peptidyl-prolyl cis-trans isomerase [Entomomonas sp. E2T0]UYZ85151.1 FKBP-type peptidyl-prolyl cis-trans isomerase [Entomomonas sp. E2T0]